jgi:hypothetical protein
MLLRASCVKHRVVLCVLIPSAGFASGNLQPTHSAWSAASCYITQAQHRAGEAVDSAKASMGQL